VLFSAKLLDRVAAVLQDSLVAVDKRDRAAARRRVHEGGVVGHQPEIGVDALIWRRSAARTVSVLNRELVALTSAVVDDGECVLRTPGSWMCVAEKITGYWLSGIGYRGMPIAIADSLLICTPWPSPVPVSIQRGQCGSTVRPATRQPWLSVVHSAGHYTGRRRDRRARLQSDGRPVRRDRGIVHQAGRQSRAIGAMAESAPAEMDPDFQPGMNPSKSSRPRSTSHARVSSRISSCTARNAREEARKDVPW